MGQIGCNPEMWEKILDAVPSDHLGLSCDPSHWLWMHILPVEDVIRDFAGHWYYADVKDCEISPRMLYRQGIIGNWWWQYRVPGRGQLNWSTIIGALWESGYDYVLCVENEDRGFPGHRGLCPLAGNTCAACCRPRSSVLSGKVGIGRRAGGSVGIRN